MFRGIITLLSAFIYCRTFDALAMLMQYPVAVGSVRHIMSFTDTVQLTKNIGVFRKRRKVGTNYRRH